MKWFGGTALAIAYTSDVTNLKPNDLTVISINYASVWTRITTFNIPTGMPACPSGGCLCTWNWIHEVISFWSSNCLQRRWWEFRSVCRPLMGRVMDSRSTTFCIGVTCLEPSTTPIPSLLERLRCQSIVRRITRYAFPVPRYQWWALHNFISPL